MSPARPIVDDEDDPLSGTTGTDPVRADPARSTTARPEAADRVRGHGRPTPEVR
ncbi:MAG: hypothetical protein GXY13_07500 [Acidimicrobiales bacterium]|mgnify:CR=1 FL=1|nr:hypothetical protein [Acidimicrobiales bacterium]